MRCGSTGRSPPKGHKDNQRLGTSNIWGKTKRAVAVQFGEEKAKGDLIDVCEMAGTKDGTRLLSVVPSERTGGNGHKWHLGNCCISCILLICKKKLVLWGWSHRLLREAVGSPGVFRSQLYTMMRRLSSWLLFGRWRLNSMNYTSPFPPQLLCDFVNMLFWTLSYKVLKVYTHTMAAKGSHEAF